MQDKNVSGNLGCGADLDSKQTYLVTRYLYKEKIALTQTTIICSLSRREIHQSEQQKEIKKKKDDNSVTGTQRLNQTDAGMLHDINLLLPTCSIQQRRKEIKYRSPKARPRTFLFKSSDLEGGKKYWMFSHWCGGYSHHQAQQAHN